jgi:deoxyribose-phosphate aldolase
MPDHLIPLIDLTSLNDDDTPEVVRDLCERAQTPRGPVAAVCIHPPFVAVAAEALAGSPVKVATVSDFPAGSGGVSEAVAQTRASIAAGAEEVDVVAPWQAFVAGDPEALTRVVAACAEAARGKVLKVILETGSHPDTDVTRRMADAALKSGAGFLKTSTGKVGQGATPAAARVLLEAVRDHGSGGVKISGGVSTRAEADAYISLAQGILGASWVTPANFRIGASSLLDDLLEPDDAA